MILIHNGHFSYLKKYFQITKRKFPIIGNFQICLFVYVKYYFFLPRTTNAAPNAAPALTNAITIVNHTGVPEDLSTIA